MIHPLFDILACREREFYPSYILSVSKHEMGLNEFHINYPVVV
jgi:hypothetical protein